MFVEFGDSGLLTSCLLSAKIADKDKIIYAMFIQINTSNHNNRVISVNKQQNLQS
jgi:hypothetical protein